jgi:hypothetical protein
MSVGTSIAAAALTRSIKRLVITGDPIWFRKLVTITLTGSVSTPANLVFLVYRGATLVALVDGFTGPDAAATGSLDTNTAEIEDAMDGADKGEIRQFSVYVYDSDPTSLELLGMGTMDIYATRDYSATAPIPPLSDTTVFIGSFAFYNGKTYIRSSTDGLYYEFAAAGSGSTATEALSTTGITIPGSP